MVSRGLLSYSSSFLYIGIGCYVLSLMGMISSSNSVYGFVQQGQINSPNRSCNTPGDVNACRPSSISRTTFPLIASSTIQKPPSYRQPLTASSKLFNNNNSNKNNNGINENYDNNNQIHQEISSPMQNKFSMRQIQSKLYAIPLRASRTADSFDETKGYTTYVVPKFLPTEELSTTEELKSCFGLSRQLKRPLSVSDKLKSIFFGLKSKYSNLNHEDEINSLYRFFGLPYLADGKFSTLLSRYETMMEKYKQDRKMKILIDWNLDKIIDHILYMRVVHGQTLLNAEDNVTYKFIKNRFIEMDKTKLERNQERLGLLSNQEREKAIEMKAKESYRRNSLLSYFNPIAYVQYYVFTLQKSFVGFNGANITYLAVLAPLYIMVYNYITTTLFARIFGSFLASWVLYSKGLPTGQGGRAPPVSRSRLKEAISCVFFMGFVGVFFGKLYVAGGFPIPFDYTTREQWNTFTALLSMLLAPNIFTVRFRQ